MSAAAAALTNLARAAATIGIGSTIAMQAMYDGACAMRRARGSARAGRVGGAARASEIARE